MTCCSERDDGFSELEANLAVPINANVNVVESLTTNHITHSHHHTYQQFPSKHKADKIYHTNTLRGLPSQLFNIFTISS